MLPLEVGAWLLTVLPTDATRPPKLLTAEETTGPTAPIPTTSISAPNTTTEEPRRSLATSGSPRRRSIRR